MNSFKLGAIAEEIAMAHERNRLGKEVADKYLKSVNDKPVLGYDIESVESENTLKPRFIEVKTSNSRGEVIISDHQVKVLRSLAERAFLYVVSLKSKSVERIIQNPIGEDFEARSKVNSYNFKI